MKAEEIIQVIEDLGLGVKDMGYSYNLNDDDEKEIKEKCGDFKYIREAKREVFSTDSIETIIHFTEHDVYLAYSGYYDSWNGSELDNGPFEVKPEVVEVTIYNEVK
jgi:hypothetical protein